MEEPKSSRSSRPDDERTGGDRDGSREHRDRTEWTEATQERFCKSLEAKQSRGRAGLGYRRGIGATSSGRSEADTREFFVRGLETVYEQAALENRADGTRKRNGGVEERRCEAGPKHSQDRNSSGRWRRRRSASTSTSERSRSDDGRRERRRETKKDRRDSKQREAQGRRRGRSRGSSVENRGRSSRGRSPDRQRMSRVRRDSTSPGRSGRIRRCSPSSSRRSRAHEGRHRDSKRGSREKSPIYHSSASDRGRREADSRSPESRRAQDRSVFPASSHHSPCSFKPLDTERGSFSPNNYGKSTRCSGMPLCPVSSKSVSQSTAKPHNLEESGRVSRVRTDSRSGRDFERHGDSALISGGDGGPHSQTQSGDPATKALRERVRDRLKAAERTWRSRNLGTDKCPKTAREGWLATVKAMIDEESNEVAAENKWDSVVSRQEEGQERIKIQTLIDQEDETLFTAYLEQRRQGTQQRPELVQSSTELTTASRQGRASGASSLGVTGEASHLEAIFGAGILQSTPPERESNPVATYESPNCQLTARLPGVNGLTLLADTVLMQTGTAGAAWKRRRQLTQRGDTS